MLTETLGIDGNENAGTPERKPAKMVASGTRRKAPARKRFDKLLLARLKKSEGRKDVVQWLAEQLRTSASYVSRMLDNKTPRRNSEGVDFNMWARLKSKLTSEEIALLEEMETE